MPLKKADKSKIQSSQEKIIKKKASPVAKSKDATTKKIVKKSTTSAPKKTVKTKVVSKKSEINSNTKTVKVKVVKIRSARTKTAKKNDLQEKKQIVENIQENIVLPVSEDAIKSKEQKKVIENNILQNETDKSNVKQEETSSSIIEANKKEQNVQQDEDEIEAKKEKSKKVEQPDKEVVENKYKAVIFINELITVRDLADKMKLRAGDVLKKLLSMGSLATINQRLDTDTAILLANEFGYDAKIDSIYSEEKIIRPKEDPSKLKVRPPVVTIMGHVDHGKTSLLDAIRDSDVVSGEHGGITQHIGAYKVKTTSGQDVAFLDTPGHEAFTAMRSRGAQATDIVVLVVSAADGVMPQTVEAINHAKAANVPIIVAVNKIDLPASDPQKIRQELSNYSLVPEEWGGDTIMIDISAKQRKNINSLLEMILIKAEMMELKANPDKDAEGVVIEAKLDSRKGVMVTLLVQSGTLKVGDNVVVGTTYGKIRAISDEYGKRLNLAVPSTPVEVLGINEPPQAGDKVVVVGHESQAREIAQSRREKVKVASLKSRHHLSLADVSLGQVKDLRIILKADVQGSLGALSDALERLSTSEISLKIIHRGAGSITESDVALAVASDALIVGFNLRPDSTVEKLAESEGISINVYRIIYDLIADVKAAMEGLLDPDMKEKILGKAVVKQVFKLSTYGTISGCSVIDGKIQRGAKVRLLRDNVIVFEGNISSLKRFKDDVKEIEKGYECGIGLENYSDVKVGDIIENFTTEKVARKLSN
ncbi:MAG: translation initiation factor IF-2 [Endomicrobium sp.]|jgi:translation initiation factor IF-2|uniref:translation initiation factor IF-2 n=1 Tax=Candidatus Endomicrobiellum cubanum TaxID=3242325 RepID=UPI002832B49F|nr:translation initiation factor IF-2 [Endomicrobium sp.]